MARPQRLNEAQIAEMFDPPTEHRDLVRHSTLSEADLGAIRRAAEITTASATLSCSATCAIPAERCAPASDRLRRC